MNWRSWLPQALVIILAGLWSYYPACQGDWIWDDVQYLADNPLMQDPAGYQKAWNQPRPALPLRSADGFR